MRSSSLPRRVCPEGVATEKAVLETYRLVRRVGGRDPSQRSSFGTITILRLSNGKVRLGIAASNDVLLMRDDVSNGDREGLGTRDLSRHYAVSIADHDGQILISSMPCETPSPRTNSPSARR